MKIKTQQSERGLSLLITLLFTSVLLGISASLLNVSLKQYKISGIGLSSEMAFQAAQAGLDCALYHDFSVTPSAFAVPSDGTSAQAAAASIECMGTSYSNSNGAARSGDEQRFQFSWGESPNFLCTSVSVYKFTNATALVDIIVNGENLRPGVPCPVGGECTVIKSRGYNVACNNINGNTRVVERELTQIY